jgi:hypothetical protein
MIEISITANLLAIGDIILGGKRETQVRRLSTCTLGRKGVPKIHVNDSDCYDTLAPLDVRPVLGRRDSRYHEVAESIAKVAKASQGVRRTRAESQRA